VASGVSSPLSETTGTRYDGELCRVVQQNITSANNDDREESAKNTTTAQGDVVYEQLIKNKSNNNGNWSEIVEATTHWSNTDRPAPNSDSISDDQMTRIISKLPDHREVIWIGRFGLSGRADGNIQSTSRTGSPCHRLVDEGISSASERTTV